MLALLTLTLTVSAGSGCSLKWTFIQLSYPNPNEVEASEQDAEPEATSDLAYTTYAQLMPLLVVDYDRPATVSQCLAAVAGDPGRRRAIRDYGLARATSPPTDWYDEDSDLGRLDPVWSPWPDACPVASLEDDDLARMAAGIASSGEAMVEVLLGASGGLRPSVAHLRPRMVDLDRGLSDALATSARLLGADPAVVWGGATERAAHPSLVLSGGAGNGAFAAGYVYQLLRHREEALRLSVDTQPEIHANIRDNARFGNLASTSVGALIAVAVDLYYSDLGPQPPPPGLHWSATRSRQQQALDLLQDRFVVDEWELFRVCRGNVFSLITVPGDPVPWAPQTGVLRFDPLMEDMLAPLFSEHGDVMLANDLIRVTTAIEANKNALLFLDERACRLLSGAKRQECLATAIKASISEPALVPAVPRVYSGLTYVGEEGTWLDGGLRSGSPASTGASYGGEWGRVLAINTHRYQGVPEDGFDNAVQLLERTITTFTEQTRSWELAYAQLVDEARHAARCRIEDHLGLENLRGRPCIRFPDQDAIAGTSHGLPNTTAPPAAPSTMPDGVPLGVVAAHALPPPPQQATWLRAVYVPDDVDVELSTGGYSFDSEVLLGLWLEGRRTFLANADDTVRWLGPGWRQLATSDPALRVIPGYPVFVDGEIQAVEAAWVEWEQGWQALSPGDRARNHQRLLRANLETCRCGPDTCLGP